MKKINTTQSITHAPTDGELDQIAREVGQKLAAEDKVLVRIPAIPGGDNAVECCINGYNYVIKRGQSVELPVAVVELLSTAGIV